jgi:2-methylcitrate dehydratase PrpD
MANLVTVEEQLASFVATTQFEDLPPEVVAFVQQSLLDTIAVALPASTLPGISHLVQVVRAWGGSAQALMWATAEGVPAPWAALVNGAASRALDFDDCHDIAEDHASAYIVPTSVALAGAANTTGRDLITATAVGLEVLVRMTMATVKLSMETGRQFAKVFGPAAAASRAFGLDSSQALNALGAAFGLMSGETQSYDEGPLMIRVNQGVVAAHGVMAATFAKAGITGPHQFLLGRRGFLRVIEPDGDAGRVIDELGRRWDLLGISRKPYAGCRCHHTTVEAVRACASDAPLESIEHVLVEVSSRAQAFSGEPTEMRHHPLTMIDGQFSLPYSAAAALFTSSTMVEHFGGDHAPPAEILALTNRVVTRSSADMDAIGNHVIGPARVTMTFTNGLSRTATIETPLGSPSRPLGRERIERKVKECADLAGSDEQALLRFLASVDDLPQADSCGDLLSSIKKVFSSSGGRLNG